MFTIALFFGPALGPLTGAYIINGHNNDWRFSMWVILMIAVPIAIAALFMQETSKKRLSYLREKKLGIKFPQQAGDSRLILQRLGQAFLRPLHMVFIEVSSNRNTCFSA